jgi:hypothetical protein
MNRGRAPAPVRSRRRHRAAPSRGAGPVPVPDGGLSVAVALIIGTIELLQMLGRALGPNAGYGVTALFICTWVGSVLVWKHARLARR